MSLSEKSWPQKYGFKIVGHGPTFIASVNRGSEAEESGIVPGDRIMELDGYDVSKLSSHVLTILMKETNGHPPAVGVVPSVCPIYLTCKKAQRCGFRVSTKKPITVTHMEPTGLAFAAGLRKGDVLLTVNNKSISEFGHKDLVLIAERDSLVLSIIPTGIRETTITDDFRGPKIKTSRYLFTKVAKYCGKDYHKKMSLVTVLSEYSEDWDIYSLCTSLDNLLKEPTDRKLLKHILPFIPRHQKDIFKPLLKRKKLYKDCQHVAYIPNKPAQKLSFQILRGNNPYGFVIKGSCPVHVEWLDPAGPADLAGLMPGDFIVGINEVDTKSFSHEQIVGLLQYCGPVPTLEVERYADVINDLGNNASFDTLSNISSTFGFESFDWICNEFSNVRDAEGWTFKEKMEYLLTPRERAHLQMNFLQYVNSSDIVKLYHKLEPILDNPSRKTLWLFLLTKMSKSHQEYMHLKENLSETIPNKSTKNLLEYYLNCREETKIKDALDLYLKSRNFVQVRVMERILNTPAKEELWKSIMPHLIPKHLEIIQKQRDEQRKIFANFNNEIVRKNSSNTYLPPSSVSNHEANDSDEEFKLLEAAVAAVNINNDWTPSNLSSEDDSINGRSSLSEAPGFHDNSISPCSSISQSKKSKIYSPYDFIETRSLHRGKDETQSLVLTLDTRDQISSNNRLMPQKPKRKSGMTRNGNADYKVSNEYIQSSYSSNPSIYIQKVPSLPNMNSMSTRSDNSNTQRIFQFPEQSSTQSRKAARNPHNNSKGSSSLVEELITSANVLKRNSTDDITSKSYADGDEGNKDILISVQNKTDLEPRTLQNGEKNQSSTDKTQPVLKYMNPKDSPLEFTTFGKAQDESDNASSKGKITPDIPEDKTEDPNKFDPAGIRFSDSQDSSTITKIQPTPVNEAIENENQATSVSLIKEDNNSDLSGVHDQPNNQTTKFPVQLKKVNTRTSDFKTQPPEVPYYPDGHVTVMEKIKELEALKNIPISPPPVLPPAPLSLEDKNDVPVSENVKDLQWEKIETNPSQDTVSAKSPNEDLDDIEPILMDTNSEPTKTKARPKPQKKEKVSILLPRKAYNVSILLRHVKLSVSDIKKAILEVNESVLTIELLRQLLAYAPNENEVKEYKSFEGEMENFNQADQFTYEMIQIPNYKDRIQALVFKDNFTEKAEKLKTVIANLKSASLELRESELLANILKLILDMGNYLDQGNERISGGFGFRISFLTQIDNTKASDNKTTLLHVLATAVVKEFPNSPSLNKELSSVLKVAKVPNIDVKNDMKELTSTQKNIIKIIEDIKVCDSSDKIEEIMTDFLAHTEETIKCLTESLDEALKEYQKMLCYFGEEENISTYKVFEIFATFVDKFEETRKEISMNLNP